MQAPITVYSGNRKMKQVNLDQIRVSRADSLYGPGKRVSVDLFGGRVGENPQVGLAGNKASVVSFLRGLASYIEGKE
jgi:hypothetical protein